MIFFQFPDETGERSYPGVIAYLTPNGKFWRVHCPFCGRFHEHGVPADQPIEWQPRNSHCGSGTYILIPQDRRLTETEIITIERNNDVFDKCESHSRRVQEMESGIEDLKGTRYYDQYLVAVRLSPEYQWHTQEIIKIVCGRSRRRR